MIDDANSSVNAVDDKRRSDVPINCVTLNDMMKFKCSTESNEFTLGISYNNRINYYLNYITI